MTRGGLARVLPLLRQPRYEVFPAASIEDTVVEWVPLGLTVTVTASPAKGLDATLDLTERLTGHGYHVVPHVSARLVRDDAHLAEITARLTACGIDDIFVPAGDADPPAGRFDSALALLDRLTEMGRPFPRVGVTGYPESHPRIEDDITIQAMWDKRRYATYLVSNLCFDPVTLRKWIARVRARGVALPLFVGLAGPADRARLLRMAAKAGVSESARFLAGHKEFFLRVGAPGGYSPERLLDRAAAALVAPESAVEGLHIFTFNQVRQTEQWRRSLLDQVGRPGQRRPAQRTRRTVSRSAAGLTWRRWPAGPLRAGPSCETGLAAGSAVGLEQLNRVPGRVIEQDLPAADPGDDVITERDPSTAQPVDNLLQVGDLERDAIPATGFRHRAVWHRARSASGAAPHRGAEQQPEVAPAEDGEHRRRVHFLGEAQMQAVERDRGVDIVDDVTDAHGGQWRQLLRLFRCSANSSTPFTTASRPDRRARAGRRRSGAM